MQKRHNPERSRHKNLDLLNREGIFLPNTLSHELIQVSATIVLKTEKKAVHGFVSLG